ncbi:hypothetical protein [Streptomyces griseus]|uniref:hypothetical protein n=1 Tax=Streptomyces griseus TaxID=1911 RepID=UPI0033B13E9A
MRCTARAAPPPSPTASPAPSTPRRAGPCRTLTQPNGYALHPWADLQPPGTPASAGLPALDALDGLSFHHASPGSAG